MQAQMQSTNRTSANSRNWPLELAWIAGLYIVMHVAWLIVPSFTDGDEIGGLQYAVTAASLVLGLVAIAGISQGMRWGWWMMLVILILNILLTAPEVFGLGGVLRVVSILALLVEAIVTVLLFRPAVRKGA